jgi:hypothetical protein
MTWTLIAIVGVLTWRLSSSTVIALRLDDTPACQRLTGSRQRRSGRAKPLPARCRPMELRT